jgi:hypothetical protein
MTARVVAALALIAALGVTAAVRLDAGVQDTQAKPEWTGTWRLDPTLSDAARPPRGERAPGDPIMGRGGSHPGMEPGDGVGAGKRRRRDGEHGADGMRRARLPDLMHVTRASTLVSFEDSSGAVIQEITTVAAAHAPGALRLSGRWKGDQLVVERPGRNGSTTAQTYTLEDANTLVIRTRRDLGGTSREFKRVYRRVEG